MVGTPVDALLNIAPCGFVSFADDGTIHAVNATLLHLLGYEPGELEGRRVESLMTVGSRIFYQTHFFPLVKLHGGIEEVFMILRSKAGEEVGVLSNAVRRERDGVFTTDCIFLRVRERRKYEDALLRAKQAAEEARAELQRAYEQLEEQSMELKLQHQQLQEQAAELKAASEDLHTLNEELLARTEELERLRTVAEEANQAKSNFLAVMSHELRTPLNAIAGYLEILQIGIHGPLTAQQRVSLERIDRSQRHLLRLINDVLNLARIEAGRVEYVVEELPLAELLAEVTPMVEPQLVARELAYESRVAEGLVARADREKVQQILLNLLSNAIKFTPAGGRVVVHGDWGGDTPEEVLLSVTDTGIGIPPGKLEAVFEPFVQVDTSHTRSGEGTGLGLAISRDLARGMGGDLRVRSTAGEGSTFTLVLRRG